MKKSFLKSWDLSPMAIMAVLMGFAVPSDSGSGKYWRKLQKPTKEQQAATIAACKIKQARKARNRRVCYSRCVLRQPIKHGYVRERHCELIPF